MRGRTGTTRFQVGPETADELRPELSNQLDNLSNYEENHLPQVDDRCSNHWKAKAAIEEVRRILHKHLKEIP